ncbi:hypothetical protein BJX66DRAFT_319121, partial [Aspergillus keveii]
MRRLQIRDVAHPLLHVHALLVVGIACCSPFSSWTSLVNALPARMNRRLIPMAISRYAGMFNAWP